LTLKNEFIQITKNIPQKRSLEKGKKEKEKKREHTESVIGIIKA